MSAPIRFLAAVLAGWTGFRAVTLGLVPGFTVSYAKEPPIRPMPPIVATEFAPLPPLGPALSLQGAPAAYPAARAMVPVYYPAYAYVAAPAPVPVTIPPRPPWQLPSSSSSSSDPQFYTPIRPLDEWQVSNLAAFPQRHSTPVPAVVAERAKPSLDRVQFTSWALLRGAPTPGALASGGTLGGSQAGARLTYAFNRWVAASLRSTTPVGGSRGAEIAGGLRFTPFRSIPVSITAERRQSISPYGGGRSAFALFAEGGLYRQPMPWNFNLDAYLQAGVVGLRSRDLFADGAFTFTRPVWGRFSAGFGVWGGAQPGLYRVDAAREFQSASATTSTHTQTGASGWSAMPSRLPARR